MTNTIATFEDKYGDEREIHRTRHGLRVRRTHLTPALKMNQAVSRMVGQRIKAVRLSRGLTMQELALKVGMGSGNPKDRIYAIEAATRGEGMRMGTLYALAHALGVEARDLMPSVDEVAEAAGVAHVPMIVNGFHS